MSGKAVIDSIGKNAAKLIGENRHLRGEVERLAASRAKLVESNAKLTAEVALLERRNAVRELAEGFGGGVSDRGDVKTARARVNRLLKEIDKCTALLNKD